MTRKAKGNPLAERLDDRMAALSASDEEVGAIVGRESGEVCDWRHGKTEIDADARVLLRAFLADDPSAASRALESIRTRQTRSMAGEGAEQIGVTPPPYGTADTGVLDAQPVPTIPPLPAPSSQTAESVQDGKHYESRA